MNFEIVSIKLQPVMYHDQAGMQAIQSLTELSIDRRFHSIRLLGAYSMKIQSGFDKSALKGDRQPV